MPDWQQMQHQLLHAIQIGGYIVIWFICPITHFSPEQQLIGMKFCMVIDQNVLCVFSYFRTTAPVASKWRAKHRLVRPVGLDISTAAAAEKSKRKISKNSPKILKSKFRKSVPQFFLHTNTDHVCQVSWESDKNCKSSKGNCIS